MSEKVLVYRYEGRKGETTTISAGFNGDKLLIEGCETGQGVEGFFGDWDYEYFLFADKAVCPNNILTILKGGFQSFSGIKRWFDENNIEYDVISYA